MKRRTLLLSLIILIGITVIFLACNKTNEEETDQPPTCVITNPTNGQVFERNETVIIIVDANDNDGSISEVRFFVDDTGVSTTNTFPYTYNWSTSDESLGTHSLKSTCIDNFGNKASDEITVTISDESVIPNADFSANPRSGVKPLIVNFVDQSTNNPTGFEWNFGDGNTSAQQNPSHTYENSGTYSVTLSVTNSYGADAETKQNYIVVTNENNQSTFTDPRDNQTYNTVVIGEQEWFAQNLNYETNNSWCYDNNNSNCDEYGRLYKWYAATSACPDGWHLPTDDEWKELEMFLGMSQSEADDIGWRGTNEGKKLKSTTGWYSGGNGTNEVGFSALPGGFRETNGGFYLLGSRGYWWSASEVSATYAWNRYLRYDYDKVYRDFSGRVNGISVRCVRD